MLVGSRIPPTIHDSFLERPDIVSALERPVINAAFLATVVVALEVNLRSMQRLVQFFGWLDDGTDSTYALGEIMEANSRLKGYGLLCHKSAF
jgi:hypothetical protein